MEKSSYHVDFDEWEFLPDTEFLDYHENGKKEKKKLFSNHKVFDPKTVSSGMNYIIIQSPTSPRIVTTPVPIHLEPNSGKNSGLDHELDLNKDIPPITLRKKEDLNLGLLAVADQDTVSRVFFKKMKENEFVDMKMDSPKSTNRGIKAQADLGAVQFGEKEENFDEKAAEIIEEEMVNRRNPSTKKEKIWKGTSVKIMGWKLTGMEALCCVGFAAATTICIFIFGRKPRNIQIYPENKKIKQESKSKGAIPEARGTPLDGAHIIFGSF